MATNYPIGLDAFTNPTGVDSLNSPSHSQQHADANDAIEALETKLGIGNSPAGSATAGHVLVASSGGTTSWTTVGASAINTTGGTAGQYLSAGTAGVAQWADVTAAGLTLIKTQTIGTSVTSVTVTDAFSANYDNYKILISGGASASTAGLGLRFGATASGYYTTRFGTNWTSTISGTYGSSTATEIECGSATTNGISMDVNVRSPYLSKATYVNGDYLTNVYGFFTAGWLNNTTSYTDFTILCGVALTGGTIRVYGYRNS